VAKRAIADLTRDRIWRLAWRPRLNAAGRIDDMTIGIQKCCWGRSGGRIGAGRAADQFNQDVAAIEAKMQTEAAGAVRPLARSGSQCGAAQRCLSVR